MEEDNSTSKPPSIPGETSATNERKRTLVFWTFALKAMCVVCLFPIYKNPGMTLLFIFGSAAPLFILYHYFGPFLMLWAILGSPVSPSFTWKEYSESAVEVQGRTIDCKQDEIHGTPHTLVTIRYVAPETNGLLVYQMKHLDYDPHTFFPAHYSGAIERLLVMPGYPKSAKLATDVELDAAQCDVWHSYMECQRLVRRFFLLLCGALFTWLYLISLVEKFRRQGFYDSLFWLLLSHVPIYLIFWRILPSKLGGLLNREATLVGSLAGDPRLMDATKNSSLELELSEAKRPGLGQTSTFMEHQVQPTDTFQGICLRYKITPTELRQANWFGGSNLSLAPNPLCIPQSGSNLTTIVQAEVLVDSAHPQYAPDPKLNMWKFSWIFVLAWPSGS